MERFRTCFYRPLLSSSENFERWTRNGGKDATERAGEIYRTKLPRSTSRRPSTTPYAQELEEYVVRRRAELGD